MRYQIISYDVWGNPKDGFEVNQAFRSSYFVDLPDEATDKQIRRALYDCGYCTRGILTAALEIEGTTHKIYINQTSQAVGGFKPFCELQSITEEMPNA